MIKMVKIGSIIMVLLATCMLSKSANAATATNPYIWADVPDQDVIRVGNVYYMSSTTMHMNPGVPIMKSYDLVNWEIVNYVYDTLESNDAQTLSNGKNEYGKGSWASSLRYNNGTYYVCFSSSTAGRTYIYQTKDIENGPWTRSVIQGTYHDMSLMFDNGRVFMVHGNSNISIVELTADATAIKSGGLNKTLITNAGSIAGSGGLGAEGSHFQKINGKYYLFLISWPSGGMRTELCYRSDTIDGTYTGKVVLKDSGIAQGGIVDTPNGKWYGMLFQDSGSVGRIPYIVPVTWSDGWPVFGASGKVPSSVALEAQGDTSKKIYASDEFNSTASDSELMENGGFENSAVTPWTNTGSAKISLNSQEYSSGSKSLLVQNRKNTGDGPKQILTGKVKALETYTFSAKVKYTTGPDTKQFNLCIQNGASYQGISILGSSTITKGQWGTIQGTYTLPANADLSQNFIFVETNYVASPNQTNDLMDFYVDDISFKTSTAKLPLVWQWNHNPDNANWSLTAKSGYLRLTTGKVSSSILDARNTLTQRTFGPTCSGNVAVEIGGMKDGDYAGLCAFQSKYGLVGVKMSGNSKSIVMVNASSGSAVEVASVPVTQNRVYFKLYCDFKNRTDKAYFYYSLDGTNWTSIGNTLQMSYTLPHFMGYRFALFNYATKSTGGYVDFDYFRIQ
ncbi:carbohydrate binding protein [Lachnotalea glycerini]|uniref:Carbohydrate binding protein n=1 Tax=Lachnotalea glycerini TaxID=1763509 RepID=A0A318EKX3_9FIRM|nr:family 43 glycosylhydrolase [Lachnotalea glycerini]PXV86833.1 carbohydrate binding protein [Lachnotalea glycerini]